jgi:hypothetical protein
MRHPTQTGLANLKLVEATVEYIGQREPDDRKSIDELPKGSALRAARLIGRGCMVRTKSADAGTQAAGNRLILRAIKETADAHIQVEAQRPARLMAQVGSLLLAPPNEISTVRQRMHYEVVAQIKEIDVQLKSLGRRRDHHSIGKTRALSGEKATLLGLGLITRQKHPHTLGLPALTHHDNDPHMIRGKSYDLLLINTHLNDTYETHKIQIKQGCLGLCTETRATDRLRWMQQDRYEPDIALVSGHCDFVLRPTGSDAPNLRITTNMLLGEVNSTLPPNRIDLMDAHANGLVLSMTMRDPRRMGTAYAGPAVLPVAAAA